MAGFAPIAPCDERPRGMSARRKNGFQLALLVAEALIFFASGIALYVVISRVAGPELLGQYTLVLSWMTVFQAFGSLNRLLVMRVMTSNRPSMGVSS